MGLFQKIGFLLKLNNAYEEIKMADVLVTTGSGTVKPGWKTTEFWGKVALQVFTLFGALKGFIDPKAAALIGGVLEGVYTIGRSVVKAKGGTLPEIQPLP